MKTRKDEVINVIDNDKMFGKNQILKSKKYKGKEDLINALLEDDRKYTLIEVDEIINCFMKGKVK